MATVPIITQDVQTRGIGAPQIAGVDNPNLPMERATAGASSALDDIAQKYKARGDQMQLLGVQNQLDQWEQDNLFKPGGAFSQKGNNALGVPEKYTTQFDGDMNKIVGNLDGDVAIKAQQLVQSRKGTITNQLYSHERTQLDSMGAETAKATVESGLTRAEQNFNNPAIIESAVQGSKDASTAYLRTQGASDIVIQEKAREIDQKGSYQVLGAQMMHDPAGFLDMVKDARDPNLIRNDPTAARGVRNNNPGNLTGDDPWKGKTGADAGGYLQFGTAEDGLRAMAVDLRTKQTQDGLDTVGKILTKYAPPDKNDTAAYIRAVTARIGVKPNDKLNPDDPQQQQALMAAMIQHENGAQPYGKQHIANAVTAAMTPTPDLGDAAAAGDNATGGVSVPTPAPVSAVTDNARFNALDWEHQQHIIRAAEGLNRQQNVGLRTQLESRAKDAIAMTQAGANNPNPPVVEDFTRAFGPDEGAQRWTQYTQLQDMAGAIKDVATQTPQQQADTLDHNQPVPGPGFAQQEQKYRTMIEAVKQSNAQRAADPIAFAQANKLADSTPLDFTNLQQLQAQVNGRAAAASTMTQTYGTPLKLMTNNEAKILSNALNRMPTVQKLAYLKTFRDSLNDPGMYSAALQQIRPDSPVTAMAGDYLGLDKQMTTNTHWFSPNETVTAESVASHLVEGEALLNPTKATKEADGKGKEFPMPPDGGNDGLRAPFNTYVGTAFAGNPQIADQAYQAYRAYYAAEAAKQGDYSGAYNDKIATQAAKAVVGTVITHNGGMAVAPWGMDESTFNDLAHISLDKTAKDQKLPDIVNFGNVRFENTGEQGKYLLRSGTGYVVNDARVPVVVDISQQGLNHLLSGSGQDDFKKLRGAGATSNPGKLRAPRPGIEETE